MSFENILSQDRPRKILEKALRNECIPNSYLFYGQESVGKKLAAIELAKALNCEVSGPVDGCDECSSCLKIEERTHPDFFILEPEKSSPTARQAVLKIDTVRELQKKLIYLPYQGQTKVAIINNAECMNPQAANSFLKTLEEPPSQTLIILITSNPYQLLPTIVSRCQGIRFYPLPSDAIRKIIARHLQSETGEAQPEELELRSRRANGQVARALEEDLLETSQHRKELIDLIWVVSFKRMDKAFMWTKTWAKKTDRLQMILDELTNLLRDVAVIKTSRGSCSIFNKDLSRELESLAQQKSLPALLAMFDAVQNTKAALKSNANAQLSLENMLINFCEAA
jgi:DNA polymerase-3 subunit delta'